MVTAEMEQNTQKSLAAVGGVCLVWVWLSTVLSSLGI